MTGILKLNLICLFLVFLSCNKSTEKTEENMFSGENGENAEVNDTDLDTGIAEEQRQQEVGELLRRSLPAEWISIELDSANQPIVVKPCGMSVPEIKIVEKEGYTYINYFNTAGEWDEFGVMDFIRLPDDEPANLSVFQVDLARVGGGGMKSVTVSYNEEVSFWNNLDMEFDLKMAPRELAKSYRYVKQSCEEVAD